MSFSEQVKQELNKAPLKLMCCRRAFLIGLLYGAVAEYNTVTVKLPESVAEHAISEIKRHFGRDAVCEPYVQGKNRGVKVCFESSKCASMIRTWDASEAADPTAGFKCENCAGAFLRGVFCAKGTVADPASGTHLEFYCTNASRARGLQTVLANKGLEFRLLQRAGSVGVYSKSGAVLEDTMGVMGCSLMMFHLFDEQIKRQLRGMENRRTNCDTGNIGKSVSAAHKQCVAIEKLLRLDRLEKLPDAMRETAMLRLRYKDATLGELVELHVPAITKSGLNHRLQKLIDLADELPD